MNKKVYVNIGLYWLLLFWLFWSASLALDEFRNWQICPTLLGIPACYIIFSAFVALFILHFFKMHKDYFYAVVIVPISIALYGTFFQIFWWIECPKTSGWIPMCFISLALFSSIALLKGIAWKIGNE
jgi:hypothetical protein